MEVCFLKFLYSFKALFLKEINDLDGFLEQVRLKVELLRCPPEWTQ